MRNPDRRKLRRAPLVMWVAGAVLMGLIGCKGREAPPPPPVVPPREVVAPLPPPVNPPALTWQTTPDDPQWAVIDKLDADGKHQEAAVAVGLLRERAQAKGDEESWAKALLRQTQYRIAQPEPGQESIASFETALRLLRAAQWPAAPLPRLLVELFYARSLILYLDQYSYQIRQRERVAAGAQVDLKVWTAEQVVAEAQRALGRLWEQRAAFGGTPVSVLSPLLGANNYPPAVRGTLRDALTYQIVELLADTAYWRPEAVSEIYRLDFAALRHGEPRAALALRIDDPQQHPLVRVAAALTDLESWHARSDRPAAALEARLTTLRTLRQLFTAPTERAALRTDLTQRLDAPELRRVAWSAMGHAELARTVREDLSDLVRARALAEVGAKSFPDSEGGKECARLVAEIDAPEFSLEAMVADGEAQRSLRIRHRNTAALYLRAYAVDFRKLLTGRGSEELLPQRPQVELLLYGDPAQHRPAALPIAEWTVPLAATSDFQDHFTFAALPLLRRGLYVIVASYRSDFAPEDNRVLAVNFQRSELALVTRSEDDGGLRATVVEAATGSPARGAKVLAYASSYNSPARLFETKAVDANGSVRLAPRRFGDQVTLVAERGDDRIIESRTLGLFNMSESGEDRADMIYTDRPIYRPQQKLYFKVLAYVGKESSGKFRPRPRQTIKVRLLDANYQEVDKRELQTNGFGTAAGVFTLPAGRLLGQWSVHTKDGSTHVQVEEYKRPTFEVALQAPKAALRLNRPAVLHGDAHYYFGLPVAHGLVRYRISRQSVHSFESAWARPAWSRKLYGIPDHDGESTVARGEAPLAADGTFQVEFTPQADEQKSQDQALMYSYNLTADLTDEGGETRSASRVYHIGFVAVRAELSANFGFLNAGATSGVIKVLRQDLDGSPLAGAGSYKLVRLVQPKVAALPAEVPLPEAPSTTSSSPRLLLPGDRQRSRFESGYDPAAVLTTWADGEAIKTDELTASPASESSVSLPALPPGPYRLRYVTKDEFGTPYTTAREFVVADEKQGAGTAVALTLEIEQSTLLVGQTARVLLHTGFADQPIYFDVYRAGVLVARRLITPSVAGARDLAPRILELPVREADRGGFTVQAFIVRDHQFIELQRSVKVPWDNMELKLSFATFRDTLRPGGKEKWRISVHAPDGKALAAGAAELLGLMYDRSLDLFAPFQAPSPRSLFPERSERVDMQSTCVATELLTLADQPLGKIPEKIELHGDTLELDRSPVTGARQPGMFAPSPSPKLFKAKAERKRSVSDPAAKDEESGYEADAMVEKAAAPEPVEASKQAGKRSPDARPATAAPPPVTPSSAPPPRTNFAETAFFFPQLLTDGDSGVAFEFTVPESNTSWRFWAQALSRTLQSGTIEAQAHTVKELMVRPYLPRFLREGDRADLRVVVNNAGTTAYDGTLELAVLDAESRELRSASFGVTQPSQSFHVEPGQGTTVRFPLLAPRDVGLYAVQVTARAGELSDGELRPLPVLPSRTHLLQSKFVTLREPGTRTISFADMKKNDDPTRLQEQLVVTLDAQLFYTALKALPYLVSYPYECTEQTLNRFLSTGIVSSLFERHPEIGRAAAALAKQRQTELDPWDQQDPNRKLALEESPWLQESRGGNKSRQDARLLRLLDPGVAKANRDAALMKLRKAQLASGAFPWFAGGPASPQTTLYLVHGLARAAEFEVPLDRGMAVRAWQYLARQYRDEYAKHLTDGKADPYFLVSLNYAASSFVDVKSVGVTLRPEEQTAILDYTFARWQKLPRLLRAQLALTLKRLGRAPDAQLVLASILDASKTEPDFGTYFAPEDQPWLWYSDTIESHAFILRALIELDPHNAKKDGLILWLLVNKKLNQWKSTRATAEVLYSLAHVMKTEGTLGIKEEALVRVGAVEERFTFLPSKYVGKVQLVIPGAQIDPAQTSTVTITKPTAGVMFASATWHFSTEQLPTQAVGDLFHVERRYFRRANNGKEFVLTPITDGTTVAIGDELEVQLTLRSQQAAEYVHLRDPRAAGLEPESTNSGYRWDLGAGAYEEVRDSGANYFFERLPAGEYVLKYRLRANLAGAFRVGPATVQSLYAPEFGAYSTGQLLNIVAKSPAQ